MAVGGGLGKCRQGETLDQRRMLYYNSNENPMTHQHVHPEPTVSGSILRLSVGQRLLGALALSAVIWGVTWWAMT
jgi:hypothetical protein